MSHTVTDCTWVKLPAGNRRLTNEMLPKTEQLLGPMFAHNPPRADSVCCSLIISEKQVGHRSAAGRRVNKQERRISDGSPGCSPAAAVLTNTRTVANRFERKP